MLHGRRAGLTGVPYEHCFPPAAQQNPDFRETRTWRRGARSLDREPFALALCNGMDVSNSFDTDPNRANICSFYIS
jgi:hypothetical protein